MRMFQYIDDWFLLFVVPSFLPTVFSSSVILSSLFVNSGVNFIQQIRRGQVSLFFFFQAGYGNLSYSGLAKR